jgi:hypothetical protein
MPARSPAPPGTKLTPARDGPLWLMTTRRRKLLIAVALLVVMAALVWWFGRGGGKLEVKLMFVGFTNDSTSGNKALVLATNSGSATALLISYGNGSHPGPLEPDLFGFFAFPSDVGVQFPSSGNTFPARLEPGETLVMSMSFTRLDKRMDAHLLAQRYNLKDRLYLRALSTGNNTLMNLANRFLSHPPGEMPILGPITKLPPDTLPADLPRVARL